ncbi:hypothetical protein QLQ12_33345 [Actinoplanes sp. NEAU-A12]|uniref:Uncharacterized protein n=1 Tax=Actinoplanes sandaracinus TaxID=3045177 RepID=A0ABT6WUT7_9ACTN|nr:hypothetical protein [Actinoplanes sandaracinus]MDI6103507.1 hypothetical protein [Actinoplanes sandaracinus]
MEIRLWSVAGEADAVAVAGAGAKVRETGDTVFAAGPDATVVIARGLRNAEDLTVSGPFPRLIEGRLTGGDGLPLHAFARLGDGCLALGTARVSALGRRRGVLHRLDLRLDTPLPEHLLDLAGTPAEQPGADWLDLLPEDPVKALEMFVADWYAEVPPGTPLPARGQPEPLRAFHRAAAGRPEVYGGSLLVHGEPAPGGPAGMPIIGESADGTFEVLIEAGADDPHVYYQGLSDQPLRERERLSAYLMLMVLARAAMDRPPDGLAEGGMAFADRAQARRIVAPLRRVPLRPLRWPCARSRLYAGPGTVVLLGADDADWFEVYVGTRHRSVLRRLRKIGLDWEHFDG